MADFCFDGREKQYIPVKNPVLFGWTAKIGAVAKFLDNLLLELWI